ncbi:sorting nexin-16 isoform X3 [Diceros bicornis minor]|uniref:sorting nexin-16 isoform X3 n=1 Tax=Diceros bicornis minor TaxID=77932 RepID=UPI0026F19C9F|nr:sorting nexin-16 isoform X3 [Diceros bicornis minor]
MATPFVPVPMPIGNAASSFTTNRNQRSSSFGSVSTSSNSSKGHLEDSNMGNSRQTSVPDQMDSTSSICSSPLIRTKFTGADSSIEYTARPRESEEQNPETGNLEDRPSTPTILGYEVMEERAKFTVYKILVKKAPEESWIVFRRYTDFSRLNDKAFCETLEETNYRFQKELLEKQKEVESLKKLLSEQQRHIDALENRIRTLSLEPEESLHVSAIEGGQILKVESPALEVDQDVLDEESGADDKPSLNFGEPGNSLSEIEVAEVAYSAEED